MKTLSKRYLAALRTYLAGDAAASLEPAAELGRDALRLELAVPDLALVHEEALVAVMAVAPKARVSDGTIPRAGCFFQEALAPLVEAATAKPPDKKSVKRKPAADLIAVQKRLHRETAKRKDAESTLKEERRLYAKLLAESKIMQKQLRSLSHEVLRAQEEERKKISRELHDEISQILTGINVRLAALRIEATANSEPISEKIASVQRLVEKSVATVHRFARELRPAMLDDLGLIPALTTHLKEVRKRTGLQIHLTASKAAMTEDVNSLKRTVLFRIAQEALNNVAKHAKANLVKVTVQVDPGHICLEVTDDGKAFSVHDVIAKKRRKRLGLIGMRERAEMVGGTFDIVSAKGQGTTVRVRIPLHGGVGS